MSNDSYVIPNLNEDWTLMGAKLNEWSCGLMSFLICSEFFDKPARAAPVLIGIMVGVTLGLAMLRRRFPDEEKGMRNFAFSSIGIAPPGIPTPANMQPTWSGAPLRALDESKEFVTLKLQEMLDLDKQEQEEGR